MSERTVRPWRAALAGGILATAGPVAGAEPDTVEDLERRVEQLEERLEATAEVAERAREGRAEKERRTHIGGYGELHYNNWDNRLAGGDDVDMLDFHRFVLFFGHEFTDDLRFDSELEVEHALSGDGEPGEVELEQAYVEFDLNDRHRARGGLFLIPVGILNDTHEPPTFYGVERNPVENNIIPTTWWAGGAALVGELAPGVSYDLAVHEGLKTSAADGFAVRDGRQKTAKADASDLAYTTRLKWTGLPGLELAGALQYQQDITQDSGDNAGGATLYEAHAIWNNAGSAAQRGFGLRALYAMWDLDGSGPEAVGADEQSGWYVEPSWKFGPSVGVFTRFSQWDNRAGNGGDTEFDQWDVGLNYWPHPDVVIKADYQDQSSPAGSDEFDGFNLGIGYQFY
ncbi:MAG: porin [Gammaproteobacteria bacterium]|nr:porin [Gammaproteobacteria bacterium]